MVNKTVVFFLFCSILLLFCQCQDKQATIYSIPFSDLDVARLVVPVLHIEDNTLFICKSNSLEKHNLQEQQLSWTHKWKDAGRGFLSVNQKLVVAIEYSAAQEQRTLLQILGTQEGQVQYQDTILGGINFLWAVPDSDYYLLHTTIYQDSTIKNVLQCRHIVTGHIRWTLPASLLSAPSSFQAPYAYISQNSKLQVLDVENGVLKDDCLPYLDTTVRFYQHQQVSTARRILNWYQHLPQTCDLSPKGWSYQIGLSNLETIILAQQGDTVLYQLRKGAITPIAFKSLKKPLRKLLATVPTKGFIYQLEEPASSIYYYDYQHATEQPIQLVTTSVDKGELFPRLLYSHPYILYLNQQDKTNSEYLIQCQNIATVVK